MLYKLSLRSDLRIVIEKHLVQLMCEFIGVVLAKYNGEVPLGLSQIVSTPWRKRGIGGIEMIFHPLSAFGPNNFKSDSQRS